MPVERKHTQHIEYLPYGETFFERRDYWNTPYKFNAKELDQETGLYYYGARYYTPEVSIWLSVDPASEMYPSTSPFMYVRGNPIRLIDPNGMWDDYYETESGEVVHRNSSEDIIYENGQKLTNIRFLIVVTILFQFQLQFQHIQGNQTRKETLITRLKIKLVIMDQFLKENTISILMNLQN